MLERQPTRLFFSCAIFSSAIVVVLALATCNPTDSGGNAPPGTLVVSNVARDLAPDAPAEDMAELVAGNTRFAASAYQELRHRPGNLFYSPHSVSVAMAMTYGGARGDTRSQMAEVLSFTLPDDRLHRAFHALDLALARRGQGAQGADGQGFRLNIINQTFGQEGYEFVPEYLDLLAEHYGAGMALLDFADFPEDARQDINEWVASTTEGRIDQLLPPGSIDEATRLVLTNAVYFNAAWKTPFDPDATMPAAFQTPAGEVTTPTMSGLVDDLTYMSGDGYQAVGIPYDGDELRMVVMVPDLGAFEAFEDALDGALLEHVFASLAPSTYGIVTMPRFGFRTQVEMVETFQALGLTNAFNRYADFSGINGRMDLVITGIFHEAFVRVNEAGTEAAAATGVVIGETSLPETFAIDRPFLFAIQDIQTNAVLFLGRVVDPTSM